VHGAFALNTLVLNAKFTQFKVHLVTSPHRKMYFMGSGKGVKSQLFQAFTRGARPDSNSRPAVQISNSLSSRYAPWRQSALGAHTYFIFFSFLSFFYLLFFKFVDAKTIGKKVEKYEMVVHWSNRVENMCFFFLCFLYFFFFFFLKNDEN